MIKVSAWLTASEGFEEESVPRLSLACSRLNSISALSSDTRVKCHFFWEALPGLLDQVKFPYLVPLFFSSRITLSRVCNICLKLR